MQNAGQQDSAAVSRLQAQFAEQFFNISEPGLRTSIATAVQDLGQPGQEPLSIKNAFTAATDQTNRTYAGQATRDTATMGQLAKQSGITANQVSVADASTQVLADLESGRRSSIRGLKEQETDAAIQQRDFDLANLFGISQGVIGQGYGFTNAQLGVDKLYPAGSPGSSAISGAASGASIGSAAGPWGALIGGVLGGAAGYFSYPSNP